MLRVARKDCSTPSPATRPDATNGPAFSVGFSRPRASKVQRRKAAAGSAKNSQRGRGQMHRMTVVAVDPSRIALCAQQERHCGVGTRPLAMLRVLA